MHIDPNDIFRAFFQGGGMPMGGMPGGTRGGRMPGGMRFNFVGPGGGFGAGACARAQAGPSQRNAPSPTAHASAHSAHSARSARVALVVRVAHGGGAEA